MKKITTRFALLMAAAAVVPLLGYGAVSILSLRTGAQQAVIQGNLNVAGRAAEQIELYVTGSVKILKAVAADLQQTGLETWQKDRILKNFVLQFPEFRELTLLDDNGRATVSSSLGPPSASVPGSEGVNVEGALMSNFSVDDDLLPTAVVAVRLDDNVNKGWLVGRLNLEELWRMVDRIRVGDQGYALVVTGEGQLLAHGDPDEKSRVARGDKMLSHPLFVAMTQKRGEGTASAEYSDSRGDVLAVAAPLRGLGWTVIVEQPLSEAFAIPIRLQRQLVVAITLALLAMLAAGYYWGSSFINPILALTRGTRALAAGRLEERVLVQTRDELGQLGEAFNNMADRLVELQDDVRKKERQAVFGRVAVGLVHDLSHPIQNIGNSCKLIMKMFDDHEYRETFKRTVEREMVMIKRVLDDLRNIARPIPLERFPVEIQRSVTEVVDSMQPHAETAGVTLQLETSAEPAFIEGDVFALGRVYRNLILNAIQATAPGGLITVGTETRADRVFVRVQDTGCGIPADRLAAIFEDFVTTKRRGLGLGLAISRKIVDQLGGQITVTSEVGKGTTFVLEFPRTRARPMLVAG